MMVNIGVVVGSHLNDAMIEVSLNPGLVRDRLKFVKALTFYNEDLTRDVTQKYLDWLWLEIIENGRYGAPYIRESLTIV
jgi:hypothetical protein